MDEDRFALTVLGIIEPALRPFVLSNDHAKQAATAVVDALELHMRRHYAKDGATAAIVLDGVLQFGSVEAADDEVALT